MEKIILIGNAFPLTLVRRPVQITLATIAELRNEFKDAQIYSFWGHDNTMVAASRAIGFTLKPEIPRPVLELDANDLPCLDGMSFSCCWIVSPNYIEHFRPEPGAEVPLSMIKDWQILKIIWERCDH
ncbi:MAG: hypothetical protein PHS31_06470 [Victivallaceae bacterium]|nr:hypothetical protein [Victivallaceae bacterium]MDD4180508.1 hypothetical protein [Victivallaceae bacterium]